MQITDPIADMLTRIRNANTAKHRHRGCARFQHEEGYCPDPCWTRAISRTIQLIDDGTQGVIRITLKYQGSKEKVISGLRRVSKPGLRVYAGAEELPQVLTRPGHRHHFHFQGRHDRQGCSCSSTSAAKSWRLSGKGGYEICPELVECPLPSPPASTFTVADGNVVTVKGPKGTLTADLPAPT